MAYGKGHVVVASAIDLFRKERNSVDLARQLHVCVV